MSLIGMSFVSTDDGGECPRIKSAWAPTRTGDYAADCEQGRAYFQELRGMMAANANPSYLSHVLHAQMEGGQWDGVEIGFAQAMGEMITVAV